MFFLRNSVRNIICHIVLNGKFFYTMSDRKFNHVPSSSWSPDDAGRSTSWEDGLGQGDVKKVMKDQAKLERKRHVAEQYENRIQTDAMARERKERDRQQNHRWVLLLVAISQGRVRCILHGRIQGGGLG